MIEKVNMDPEKGAKPPTSSIKENNVNDCDPKIDIEDEHTDGDDNDGLPIDRGWAWVVAVAASLNQMLRIGYMRSMGILFIEFLRVYQTSATVTTLISGVMAGVFGVAVFVSMQVLVGRIPIRYIIVVGGSLSGIGIISSAFATNIIMLIALQSVFIGIGNSMIHGPAVVLIGQYFKKKRGIGMAFANSGISVGAVVFPPLVKYLLDEYGLQGTLLIIGGMELHVIALAIVMRPIEFWKRKKKVVPETELKLISKSFHAAQKSESKPTSTIEYKTTPKIERSAAKTKDHIYIKNQNNQHLSSLLNEGSHIRPRTFSQSSRISEFHSQNDIYSIIPVEDTSSEDGGKRKKSLNPCTSLDFSLWRKPNFLFLILTTFFAVFQVLFLSYYPAYVTDEGTSKQDAATFMSIAGGLDFFARLAAGYLSDLGYVKRTYICVFTLTVSAINCIMVTFYTTYELQLLGCILYGLFGGIYQSFIPLLLIDFLGQENLAKSLGFILIMIGITLSMLHPLIGALKDATGSYRAAYHLMGAALLIAIALILLEPLLRRCTKRDNAKETMIGVKKNNTDSD